FDRHVFGDPPFVDELAHEVEIGLRSRREADFDLFEADRDEHVEELELLRDAHRLDQGLIAVAQIGAHPNRGALDRAGGPFSPGQLDGREGAVLGGGVAKHDGPRVFGASAKRGESSGWPMLPGRDAATSAVSRSVRAVLGRMLTTTGCRRNYGFGVKRKRLGVLLEDRADGCAALRLAYASRSDRGRARRPKVIRREN